VDSLSSKKQDKALIHAKRARNIKAVLIDKKTTAVESAQFRSVQYLLHHEETLQAAAEPAQVFYPHGYLKTEAARLTKIFLASG
jgi:hypothetical protein